MLNSDEHEILMLINIQIAKINGKFRFKSPKSVIYPASKYQNANIYEQDIFHAQLSMKKFHNLDARFILTSTTPQWQGGEG